VLTEICLVLFEFEAGEGDGVYIDESRCEIKLGVKLLCILQVFVHRPQQRYAAACQWDRISAKHWGTENTKVTCSSILCCEKIPFVAYFSEI
jgi:hypothetical protein